MTDLARYLDEVVRIVRSAGLDIVSITVTDGLIEVSVSGGREYMVDLRTCEAVAVVEYEKLGKDALRSILETVEILERACSKAW